MRRHGLIGALLCFLAVWVQFMAPVAAAALDQTDPLGGAILCSHDSLAQSSAPDDRDQSLPPPSHQHCLFCQVCLGGALIPDRLAFTALDYPVASPLRWLLPSVTPAVSPGHSPGQPRGPPSLL